MLLEKVPTILPYLDNANILESNLMRKGERERRSVGQGHDAEAAAETAMDASRGGPRLGYPPRNSEESAGNNDFDESALPGPDAAAEAEMAAITSINTKAPSRPKGSNAPLPKAVVLYNAGTVRSGPAHLKGADKIRADYLANISRNYETVIRMRDPTAHEHPEIYNNKRVLVLKSMTKRFLHMPVKVAPSVLWKTLTDNMKKALHRTEEQMNLMSSNCSNLITDSAVIRSDDPQPRDLLVFWHDALFQAFGRDYGDNLLKDLAIDLDSLAAVYPPHAPARSDARRFDHPKSHPSGVEGLYHLCWWFEQAHEKHSNPIVSGDIIKSAHKLEAVVKFFNSIGPLQQIIGLLLLAMDPEAYGGFFEQLQKTSNNTAWKMFGSSRRSCYHGLVILRNLCVRAHRDRRDSSDGWTAMTCEGTFTGGFLVIPDLGIRIQVI